MNPQTLQETKRILVVIDDLIEDLEILSLLPHNITDIPQAEIKRIASSYSNNNNNNNNNNNDNNNNNNILDSIQSLLSEHYNIEKKIIIGTAATTKKDISEHHLSTRAVVSLLRNTGYPNITDILINNNNIVNNTNIRLTYPDNIPVKKYTSIINILRQLLRERLSATVEDDVVKFIILNDNVNREKTASADIRGLNREYINEKESRVSEVAKRKQNIQRLKEELDRIKSTSTIEMANYSKAAEEDYNTQEKDCNNKYKELQEKEEIINNNHNILERKHMESEALTRQIRSKKEKELIEILRVYDSEMASLTTAISTLSREIEEDSHTLYIVDKQVTELSAEAAAYELERQNDQVRRDHCEDINIRINNSASVIQAFIRSYTDRQLAIPKKKKRGGKGSGKK